MATDLTGLKAKLELLLTAEPAKTADFATMKAPVTLAKVLEMSFGASATQLNQIWWDRRVLAGGADDELDFTGVLKNPFGVTVSFSTVDLILVINRSALTTTTPAHTATEATISVGPGAANDWLGPFQADSDRLNVFHGCPLLLLDPYHNTFVSGADDLKITNEEGAIEAMYDILMAGTSV